MWNNGNDCGCLWIILLVILLCCCGGWGASPGGCQCGCGRGDDCC